MHFSPRQVDEMTMWELGACVDGVNRANGAEPPVEPPTDAEFDAMLERRSIRLLQ